MILARLLYNRSFLAKSLKISGKSLNIDFFFSEHELMLGKIWKEAVLNHTLPPIKEDNYLIEYVLIKFLLQQDYLLYAEFCVIF